MTWSRVRRLIQALVLVAFIALTVSSVGLGWRWLPGNLFSRADPLVGLSAMLASRAWVAFWVVALGTIVLTLVFGRAWCGWICPVGTLLDLVPARKRKPTQRTSRRWRWGKYVTLAVVVGAAALGNLGPMVFDPVTVLARPLQELARPFVGTDAVGQSVGATLSRGAVPAVAFISLIPLVVVLALNAIERRVWCRDVCPLGALLALIARVPGVRRVVDAETCTSCGRCRAACPMDAVSREEGYASSPAECTDCMACIDVCPSGANKFALATSTLGFPAYREDRRDALIAAGAAGLGVGAALLPGATPHAEILRPPATDERRLAELCVRCGACYQACPTGVLRPSVALLSEAGFWTPMLDERPKHCTMNCNRCAKPCPTDAIHTPTPAEAAALGLGQVAEVNKTQCRAWARNHGCMQCQGACPIAGALVGQERPYDPRRPNQHPVQVPVVDRSLCVGCNQCEAVCPMTPSAIGVNLPPYQGHGSNMPEGMPGAGGPGGDGSVYMPDVMGVQ